MRLKVASGVQTLSHSVSGVPARCAWTSAMVTYRAWHPGAGASVSDRARVPVDWLCEPLHDAKSRQTETNGRNGSHSLS